METPVKADEYIPLSATRIDTLINCSWIYWARYHLKLPDTSNDGQKRGIITHLILELLLKPKHKELFKPTRDASWEHPQPVIRRVIMKHATKLGIDDDDNVNMVEEMIRVALNNDFFCKGAEKIQSEMAFDLTSEMPKYRIKGKIDKSALFPKTVRITDYKTSKSKFSFDDLEGNTQALMYALAALKLYNLPATVDFQFLRFPRKPFQRVSFSASAIRGFERYLEYLNEYLLHFKEEDAHSNFAAKTELKWLCGSTIKGKFCCPYRGAFDYFVLLDKEGAPIRGSRRNDLVAEKAKGQKVVKRKYKGCPHWQSENLL